MMKHALAALLLLSSPAVAQECRYSNGALSVFVYDEHVTIHGLEGNFDRCGMEPWPAEESFEPTWRVTCESDWQFDLMLVSTTRDGTEHDMMILWPFGVLYRSCP